MMAADVVDVGKSTQIAQYVWESVVDQTGDRMIAVSQPRRVGAIALASQSLLRSH